MAAANTSFLIDTDVLIDYLRGQADAVSYLESLTEQLVISAITVAELFAGVREGTERQALEAFLSAFEVVDVNQSISRRGGLYRRDISKSHGVGLADALIAATAEEQEATLVTLNKKHFPMLTRVIVPYAK
jgi:predicted nucleic acid-binding protein